MTQLNSSVLQSTKTVVVPVWIISLSHELYSRDHLLVMSCLGHCNYCKSNTPDVKSGFIQVLFQFQQAGSVSRGQLVVVFPVNLVAGTVLVDCRTKEFSCVIVYLYFCKFFIKRRFLFQMSSK